MPSAVRAFAALDALVALELEARQRGHDEEVAVEVATSLRPITVELESGSFFVLSRCARTIAWLKLEAVSATNIE